MLATFQSEHTCNIPISSMCTCAPPPAQSGRQHKHADPAQQTSMCHRPHKKTAHKQSLKGVIKPQPWHKSQPSVSEKAPVLLQTPSAVPCLPSHCLQQPSHTKRLRSNCIRCSSQANTYTRSQLQATQYHHFNTSVLQEAVHPCWQCTQRWQGHSAQSAELPCRPNERMTTDANR